MFLSLCFACTLKRLLNDEWKEMFTSNTVGISNENTGKSANSMLKALMYGELSFNIFTKALSLSHSHPLSLSFSPHSIHPHIECLDFITITITSSIVFYFCLSILPSHPFAVKYVPLCFLETPARLKELLSSMYGCRRDDVIIPIILSIIVWANGNNASEDRFE